MKTPFVAAIVLQQRGFITLHLEQLFAGNDNLQT